jgi:hypothetical protein
LAKPLVVVQWQSRIAEARRKVRIGDLANFIGRGETCAVELFGVLDWGDIRRARLAGASKAALE